MTIKPLAALIEDTPNDVVPLLQFDADAPLASGFVAANSALARDGVAICVPANTRLDRPIYIHYIHRGGAAHLRCGVSIGHHAEVELIEHFTGDHAEVGLSNHVTTIRMDEGSRCTHYRLQMEAAKQMHVGRVEVVEQAHADYTLHAVELGGMVSRSDIVIDLANAAASCALNGLFVLTGRQHADHHTMVQHQAPHCRSRENYRTVLDGRAHGVFNGKIIVAEGAAKTDSAQSNANLLLSNNAEIDTKPELEIYHDDVKCAHGATVGQLDQDQLFYLKSRGISADEAKQMLTFAFADALLAEMGNATVRRFIEHNAFAKLPNLQGMEALLT